MLWKAKMENNIQCMKGLPTKTANTVLDLDCQHTDSIGLLQQCIAVMLLVLHYFIEHNTFSDYIDNNYY